MDSVLEKQIVLKLNANWVPTGFRTVKDAIIELTGGLLTPPALALDIELDADGQIVSAIPTRWDDWIKLPVRPCDLAISTASAAIRCPTVIVVPNWNQMPVKKPKFAKNAILERDGYRCIYTGEKLPKSRLNVEHIIPLARGGKNTWENTAACDKRINFDKGSRLPHEVNLKPLWKPKAPPPAPLCFSVKEAKLPEHKPFLLSHA